MSQLSLELVDFSFAHQSGGLSKESPSTTIKWERFKKLDSPVVFTDLALGCSKLPQYKNKKKIALLIEPKAILPGLYNYIEQHFSNFDYVISHHSYLKNKIPNFLYYPFCSTWIPETDRKIWKKSKLVSIIASEKNATEGHRLRHKVIRRFAKEYNIDVFGRGYNPIKNKADALRDYKFSIAIENCIEEGYWTEKLQDCILTGTIPIYWGHTGYLPSKLQSSIPKFNSLEELENILKNISLDKEPYFQENLFYLMSEEKILCPENYIYYNYRDLLK